MNVKKYSVFLSRSRLLEYTRIVSSGLFDKRVDAGKLLSKKSMHKEVSCEMQALTATSEGRPH